MTATPVTIMRTIAFLVMTRMLDGPHRHVNTSKASLVSRIRAHQLNAIRSLDGTRHHDRKLRDDLALALIERRKRPDRLHLRPQQRTRNAGDDNGRAFANNGGAAVDD